MATLTEEDLRRVYELLGSLLNEQDDDQAEDAPAWYAPPPPPVASGANLSATDLLSWWFRPPSGKKRNGWHEYFEQVPSRTRTSARVQEAEPRTDTQPATATQIVSEAVRRAANPEPEDRLASEDAEAAVEVLYAFLHAFSRGDIDGALHWVSEDYHVIEDDHEIDRNGLRCRLERLLDSFQGWDVEVSLAAPPEPIAHPYGILIYAEIQIDGSKPNEMAARSQVEHRVAVLVKTSESRWQIGALARPSI